MRVDDKDDVGNDDKIDEFDFEFDYAPHPNRSAASRHYVDLEGERRNRESE